MSDEEIREQFRKQRRKDGLIAIITIIGFTALSIIIRLAS